MAKKKQAEGEEINKFQAALDKLNKTYGSGSVLTLNTKVTEKYDVISTGSIGFDHLVLGVGGFVKGKLYELRGWESSGKSTICGHAVAECQKAGGKVLYIDGEHAVDKSYFESLGVNTDEMLIAQPSCGEEGFNIALELIETGEIDMVVFDSDSSLIPKKVLDGDVGDSSIGYKARLNSSAYPKLKSALANHKVCVISISQYREKIGIIYGPSSTTQGGHALKYYADCIIEVSKTLAKEGDATYGNITKVKTIKNKMFPPYRTTSFEIVYGRGIDRFNELMELGTDYEVVRKYGGKVTFKEDKFEYSEFETLLADNPELEESITAEIIKRIKNENLTPEKNNEEL
jgi:recombination protein RecA